ncbi:MAG: ABC transporter ATP-binding protein [Deltaproteobacteria bacterium]|jgi:branched-chain amino acid transport system ATP-binding protein
MTHLLRLEEISRTFGHLLALHNVSFVMNEGELLAVIGPNGAGKTTLFNLISGFFAPSGGIVWFQDRNINRLSTVERVHNGIVRTFQITEIFPDMTVLENVRIGVEAAAGWSRRPWISPAQRKAINTSISELLETTGLADKAYRVVSELAHGDQRVVEVAMALSLKPHLLLLDEPTAGMGDEETDRMVQLIGRLQREQGLSIVFIEHDMNIVFGIAERIVVLDQGQVIAEGTAEKISTNRDVQKAYLGEEE